MCSSSVADFVLQFVGAASTQARLRRNLAHAAECATPPWTPKLLVYVWKVCFQGDGWLEELGASMQRSEFSQRAFESHGTCSGMGNVVIMTDYGDLVCSNPTLSRV